MNNSKRVLDHPDFLSPRNEKAEQDQQTYEIKVWTDGCRKGDGNGGWCCIIKEDDSYTVLAGQGFGVTNNQMEIQPFIASLTYAKINNLQGVHIISDSQYVINSFNTWIHKWSRSGWMRKVGKNTLEPVKNLEMWQKVLDLKKEITSKASWVRGHNGDPLNELCDSISNHCYYHKTEIRMKFDSFSDLEAYF